jgi:hypothetical protein
MCFSIYFVDLCIIVHYTYINYKMSVPTTNAKGLYSTKWINSSYTGPVFTFRRSTDNVTQDFYVSGSSIGTSPGALGTSLQSWLGAATAYVTKWWDQSLLGNHATQTTNANQPTFDVSNNCIQFTSSSFQRLSLPDNTVPSGNLNYTVVVKHLDFTPLSNGFISSGPPGSTNTFGYNGGYINYWWGSDQIAGTYTANSTVSWTYDGTNRRFYLNGTLTNTMSAGGRNSGTTNNFIGFGDTSNMNYFDGKLSFIYVYNAVLSDSSRALAEANTGLGTSVSTVYPCFLEGARILRLNPETDDEEYIAVEKLRRGDLIRTAEHGYKAIELIGHTTIPNPMEASKESRRLYWFRKSKCANAGLFEDLCVTGDHCILHRTISDEKRKQIAEYMRDIYVTESHYRVPAFLDDRAEPYTRDGPATIWHFALENPNIYHNYGVMANGLLVESCSLHYMYKHSNMRMIE